MKYGVGVVFSAMAVILSAASFLWADEVAMKDGSRLLGTVVSMESGKLVFRTEFAGDITIDWKQVARLETEAPVEMSLGDGTIYKGRVETGEDGKLVLLSEEGAEASPVALAEVKAMNPPKPPEGWQAHGRLEAGLSRETGNTDKEAYNVEGELDVAKSPHEFNLYVESNQEKNFGVKKVDKSLGQLQYNRFLSKKLFLFGSGRAEQDIFSSLEFMGVATAGAGYQFWKDPEKNLRVTLGPSYAWEKYKKAQENFDNKDEREYFAATWGMDFDMWFFKHRLQLFHRNLGTLSLEDTNVWRILTRSGFRIPITKTFYTTLQYNYDYVNSPADGKEKADKKAMIKLGWKW